MPDKADNKKTGLNEIGKPAETTTENKAASVLTGIWFNVVPVILVAAALFFSIFVIYLRVDKINGEYTVKDFKNVNENADYINGDTAYRFTNSTYSLSLKVDKTEETDILEDLQTVMSGTAAPASQSDSNAGDPNIIAIVAVLSMLVCIIAVPFTALKVRKKGDGLGVMFMPLGLLGIFEIMIGLVDAKNMPWCVVLGIVLFVISAIGTFRKCIKFVDWICLGMMVVMLICLIANLMPYCFYDLDVTNYWNIKRYYVSYFIRDELLLASYAIVCGKIKHWMKINEAS